MHILSFSDLDATIIKAALIKLEVDLVMEREALLEEGRIENALNISMAEKRCAELRELLTTRKEQNV